MDPAPPAERRPVITPRFHAAWVRLLRAPHARTVLPVAFFLLGSILAFHALLLPYGGRFYDGDFVTPTTPADLRYYLEAFAGPWNSGTIVFGFNPFFTNDLILLSIVGAFSVLLGSLGTGMLAVLILVEAGLGLSLYLSARRVGVDRRWALVAGLASAASPVVFDRTVAGHEIILAAALCIPPFLVLLCEAASRPVGPRHLAVLGLLWGVVGLLEFHTFYLVGIIWATAVLAVVFRILWPREPVAWGDRLRSGGRRLGALLVAFGVAVGVNLVWLVPAETAGSGSTALSSSTATTLGILTYTQGGIQRWTVFASNVYWGQMYTTSLGTLAGVSLGVMVSYLLSILFITVLAWHASHRTRETDTLVLIALVFVVLSTGTIIPGGLYVFLLHTAPFFAVNDDPGKFDVVLTPCLCLLLGNALQHWAKVAPRGSPSVLGRLGPRWHPVVQRVRRAAVPAAVVLVVIVALPFASGNFDGRIAHVPDAPGALATANTLDASVPPLGRVALFPPDPTEYVGQGQSPTNPLVAYPPGSAIYIPGPPGIEPLNLATRSATWSYTATYNNASSHVASLFGLLGATSIVVDRAAPQSPQFGPYDWDNPYALSDVLESQSDLGPSVTNQQTRIYSIANATDGPLTLQGPSVLALADREFLLDAGYLPNGDAWVRSTPFVLDTGTLAGPNVAANATAPWVETPEGMLDKVFSELPPGSVVPVEPIIWAAISGGSLPTGALWNPWEEHYDLEYGRPLGTLVGYGTTNNGRLPLTVPMSVTGGPRSEVWVDLFYGPSEGIVQASIGGRLPVSLNAFASNPAGFHWTPVGLLGNASSVAFTHEAGGWTTIAAAAVVPPGGLSSALNATSAWMAANGAGPLQAPILWVKGDQGIGAGTLTEVGTGSRDAQGWGSVIDTDGAFTTSFYLPGPTTLGVLARASGSGAIYVSACPGSSLTDDSLAPCPNHVEVAFDSVEPTWVAGSSNVTVGPGVVKITVYGARSSVLLDQLILTPSAASLLDPCQGSPASDWVCAETVRTPGSVSGNVGGPTVRATFEARPDPSVLVHLVSCDVSWRASGPGVSPDPFLLDGWACGYLAGPGTSNVQVGIPSLLLATGVGVAGSILIAVPAGILAVFGIPKFLRRRLPPAAAGPDVPDGPNP
ncbi:MAG: hypothetical protein L3J80_00860 [Thermoplasmata archaeon]|nr:hypothetical protein [Thermoplasmata archaeon]